MKNQQDQRRHGNFQMYSKLNETDVKIIRRSLKSPYPYFGGKSKIAQDIWEILGSADRYIEPFFGSGAMLLANPHWQQTKEIVNDLNHFIANFWRAVQAEPDAVAYYCDYPTIESKTIDISGMPLPEAE